MGPAYIYNPLEEYAGKLDFEGGYDGGGGSGGYLSGDTDKNLSVKYSMMMMVMHQCAAVTNAF